MGVAAKRNPLPRPLADCPRSLPWEDGLGSSGKCGAPDATQDHDQPFDHLIAKRSRRHGRYRTFHVKRDLLELHLAVLEDGFPGFALVVTGQAHAP